MACAGLSLCGDARRQDGEAARRGEGEQRSEGLQPVGDKHRIRRRHRPEGPPHRQPHDRAEGSHRTPADRTENPLSQRPHHGPPRHLGRQQSQGMAEGMSVFQCNEGVWGDLNTNKP